MHEQQPERAMALMVCAMLVLPGIDAIAKYLSAHLSTGQVTWSRFFFQSLLMAPFAIGRGLPLSAAGLAVHAARGALLAATTGLFFQALVHMELADAISIFFVEPLLLTLLSVLFLREQVGWRRYAAIAVGLGGALVVIRPNFTQVGWPALLPLAAAACFATYLLLTRHLAQRDDPARMQFLAGVSGCLLVTPLLLVGDQLQVAALSIRWPEPWQWGLLALLGLIGTAGHLVVVHAFRLASASLLAPFQYLELVSATLLGWLVFGDLPDLATSAGAAIIVGSGLYVFHRERMLARRARQAMARQQ